MKILMIGLGSIGQRHLRNLHRRFGSEAEFLAYRVRGLQRTFSDSMQVRDGVSLEEEFSIKAFSSLDDALSQKPDVAYVTNITSEHVPCALKAVQAGCDVFLEKPISHNLDGIHELIIAAREKKAIVFVGFQNRFNPALKELRSIVRSRKLGRIISVQSEVGERLATMHSYEDYAGTYMAKSDQGGGVIMNQLIHELDYLQWIFGEPRSVAAFSGKNSGLSIDVEDYCDALYWVEGELGHFPIYAHADFFQYPPKRSCKAIFEEGWAEADLLKATLAISHGDSLTKIEYPSFQRNQMFVDEMEAFLHCVESREQDTLTLEEGAVSLRMAVAAKRAAKDKRQILLDEVTL